MFAPDVDGPSSCSSTHWGWGER